MEKIYLNIINLNKSDVITTSVCLHSNERHFYHESYFTILGFTRLTGKEYDKDGNIVQTSDIFPDDVSPKIEFDSGTFQWPTEITGKWYYYDGNKWKLCEGDHSYLN